MTTIHSLAAAAAALLLAVLLTACGGSSGDDSSGSVPDLSMSEADAPADTAARADADGGAAAVQDAAADEAGGGDADPTVAGPAIISTGMVALEDRDVADVRLQVRKVVDTHRGTVTEQETTTGEGGEVTSARLVVRVPSAAFGDAVADLEGLATLTSSSSSGEDVSAQVVDVEARIRAQRASVNRIQSLLARADSIEQIVAIESQLASRQAELDALVAQQTWLADQTSLSTITVYVEQPAESGDEPEDRDGFLGGLAAGWDSFVDGMGAALTFVGFLLPWLVLALLVGWPAWLVLRRRGGRPSSEAAAPAAAAGPSGSA